MTMIIADSMLSIRFLINLDYMIDDDWCVIAAD